MTSQHLPHIWKILFSVQHVHPFRHSCFTEKARFVPQTGYLLGRGCGGSWLQLIVIENDKVCACISVHMLVVCVLERVGPCLLMLLIALAFTSFHLFCLLCLSTQSWCCFYLLVDGPATMESSILHLNPNLLSFLNLSQASSGQKTIQTLDSSAAELWKISEMPLIPFRISKCASKLVSHSNTLC